MLELGKFSVNLFGFCTVGSVSSFCGSETAKVFTFTVDFNSGDEAFSFFDVGNSFEAASIMRWRSDIVVVLFWSCVAQIVPAVVGWILVKVIYFEFGPRTCNPQPYNSMDHVVFVFYTDFDSAFIFLLRKTCELSGRRSLGKTNFPSQISSGRIVIKNFSYEFSGQVRERPFVSSSHVDLPYVVFCTTKRAFCQCP